MFRLQVRQRIVMHTAVSEWGPWHDVPSPQWLVGFILPSDDGMRVQYEFRQVKEEN